MTLDRGVARINSLIASSTKAVFEGGSADFPALEKELGDFLEQVKLLPAEDAKQYMDLVQTWVTEIRKVHNKLAQTKSEIESEINAASAQGKAATAYITAKKLSE